MKKLNFLMIIGSDIVQTYTQSYIPLITLLCNLCTKFGLFIKKVEN